jgi:hypothetical protein
MNREFKFRAWDAKEKKMLCPLDFVEIDSNGNLFRDYKVLMQYTGIKDKNGKEIYEGDIVNIDLTCEKSLIEYNNVYAAFIVNTSPSVILFEEDFDQDQVEIIGNIFENPELLESC